MTVTETTTSDTYYRHGWWRRDATLVDDLRAATQAHPDRRAVVCWHIDGRPADALTYAQLSAEVDRIAVGLLRLGVRSGDVVTLQLPNSVWLVASCLACVRVGAVPGPVLPIMRGREVEFMLRLTNSPVYIAASAHRGFSLDRMSAEIQRSVPTLRHRILLDGTDQARAGGALDFDAALRGAEPTAAELAELDARRPRPDDLAQVIFTSGTTGEPKGVMHTHNTLHAINRVQADLLGLTPDEIRAKDPFLATLLSTRQ